jgi:hypothetical protein
MDGSTGVRSDQVARLKNDSSIMSYPDKLRRVHYVDSDSKKSLVFLSNNFDLPALVIAKLSNSRWTVVLALSGSSNTCYIKHFYATSQNVVKIPFLISICVYVLVSMFWCLS